MNKLILFGLSAIVMLANCGKGNNASRFEIGQQYGGGIIFYIDRTGQHGFIAAPYDQHAGVSWSNGNDTIRTEANGYDIYDGKPNTSKAVSMMGNGIYAARICDTMVLNGFDDWFLPSRTELNLLYAHKNEVGGLANAYYWTSTDLGGIPHAFYAANQDFTNGVMKMNYKMLKNELNKVRAIRIF
jgi:hypothetical protein